MFRDFCPKIRAVPGVWFRIAEKGIGRICWEERREAFLKVGIVPV